jgi:hypothetical protein
MYLGRHVPFAKKDGKLQMMPRQEHHRHKEAVKGSIDVMLGRQLE